MRIYNLIINSLRSHLDRGGSYEMYALYVCIKTRFTNSRMYDFSAERVMRLFGAGRARARGIVSAVRRCPLFRMDGDALVAVADRSGEVRRTRSGREYTGDMVYKLKDAPRTLKEMTYLLKRVLVQYVVGIADENIIRTRREAGLSEQYGTHGSCIRQKALASVLHLGTSETGRIVNHLARKGGIYKTEQGRSVVIDRLDPASVLEYVEGKPWRKFYRHGGQGWYGHLCGYALENGEERNFRHVIWNHPKRVSSFNTFWGRLQ